MASAAIYHVDSLNPKRDFSAANAEASFGTAGQPTPPPWILPRTDVLWVKRIGRAPLTRLQYRRGSGHPEAQQGKTQRVGWVVEDDDR